MRGDLGAGDGWLGVQRAVWPKAVVAVDEGLQDCLLLAESSRGFGCLKPINLIGMVFFMVFMCFNKRNALNLFDIFHQNTIEWE